MKRNEKRIDGKKKKGEKKEKKKKKKKKKKNDAPCFICAFTREKMLLVHQN